MIRLQSIYEARLDDNKDFVRGWNAACTEILEAAHLSYIAKEELVQEVRAMQKLAKAAKLSDNQEDVKVIFNDGYEVIIHH